MQLTLDGLGHRFSGQPWLFRRISTRLVPGEVYALTGPSGSGKSTLLGILAGWIEPSEGHIHREGIASMQWVFQSPHGSAHRTCVDHVALPLLARGHVHQEARAQARPILARFGIEHRGDAPFRELSGGEAQRLMLATAVAAEPSLLLVDEPTAQLDLVTRRSVAETIARLASPETIVVVATHDDVTRDSCSQVIDLALFQAEDAS